MLKLKSIVLFCWSSSKTYSLFFVTIVVSSVALSLLITALHHQREREYLNQITQQQHIQLKSILFTLENTADIVFENVINQPDIIDLMARASRASESERGALRTRLFERLAPAYQLMEARGGRLLHFHLPGGISFLRFHRTDVYGDDLTEVRPSINQVNESGDVVRGFEEGRVFQGFRNVYPLRQGDELVGTVDISYSFLALRDLAVRLFPAIYTLMYHKESVARVAGEEDQGRYRQCRVSPFYLKEQEAVAHIKAELPGLNIVSLETLQQLNSDLREQVAERMEARAEFSVSRLIPGDHKILVVTFLPIRNIQGDAVAYFVSYRPDRNVADYNRRYHQMRRVIVALTLIFFFSGLLYYRQTLHKEKYQALATSDRLTRLANRLHFDLVLDQILRQVRRGEQSLSLLMLDIDNFKQVNDVYGHDGGDRVLVSVAGVLRGTVREQDLAARWGGEEFVVLLPGASGEEAGRVAEKIRQAIADHETVSGSQMIQVTCSFGVAEYGKGMTAEELLKRADQGLYLAKERGKNCVVRS